MSGDYVRNARVVSVDEGKMLLEVVTNNDDLLELSSEEALVSLIFVEITEAGLIPYLPWERRTSEAIGQG